MLVYYLAIRWCVGRLRAEKAVSALDRVFRHPVTGALLLGAAGLGVLCMVYGFFVEPNRLTVTHYGIETAKIARDKRVRIVHLADLHVREKGARERRLPALVRSLDPDLILHTGDFFARGREIEPTVVELLSSWHVPQYSCEHRFSLR